MGEITSSSGHGGLEPSTAGSSQVLGTMAIKRNQWFQMGQERPINGTANITIPDNG
jgi:hypothetical protein